MTETKSALQYATLRRAHLINTRIEEYVKYHKNGVELIGFGAGALLTLDVPVSLEEAKELHAQRCAEIAKLVLKLTALLSVRHRLRMAIAAKNNEGTPETSINGLLTAKVTAERLIKLLNRVAEGRPPGVGDRQVMEAKVNAYWRRRDDHKNNPGVVAEPKWESGQYSAISPILEAEAKRRCTELSRRVDNISEELLKANTQLRVAIRPADWELLEENGIV